MEDLLASRERERVPARSHRERLLMSESDQNDQFFVAGESPGAWLHLTGDPWMTPDDMFSEQNCPHALTGESNRIGRSRDSVDTLPRYSPPRVPLPTPKDDSDVDSDTLPPILLSPPSRKEPKVLKSYNENAKKAKRSQGGPIRAPSKSKARVVRKCSNAGRKPYVYEMGERIPGFGDNQRVQQILKAKPLDALRTGAETRNKRLPSLESFREPTPLEMNNPKGLVNRHMEREGSQGSQDSSIECPLTPVEMDLGALAMIAAVPDPTTGTPSVKLKSGKLMAILTPEQTCWQRASYLPGPIRLESSFLPHSASTLTDMDLLQNPTSFGHSRTKADDIVLDDVVDFFISFGLHDPEPPAWPPHTTKPNAFTPLASSTVPVFGVNDRPGSFASSDGSSVSTRDRRASYTSSRGPYYESEFSFRDRTPSPYSSGRPVSTLPAPAASRARKSSRQSNAFTGRPRQGKRSQTAVGQKLTLRRLIAQASSIV